MEWMANQAGYYARAAQWLEKAELAHEVLGREDDWLCRPTANETLHGFFKDGFYEFLVRGNKAAVNPWGAARIIETPGLPRLRTAGSELHTPEPDTHPLRPAASIAKLHHNRNNLLLLPWSGRRRDIIPILARKLGCPGVAMMQP